MCQNVKNIIVIVEKRMDWFTLQCFPLSESFGCLSLKFLEYRI